MDYEEKIRELTERVAKLEKAEAKRSLKEKIRFFMGIARVLIIVIVIAIFYFYINENFVKPYKERIDSLGLKVDTVEDFVKGKWEDIKKYNIFN